MAAQLAEGQEAERATRATELAAAAEVAHDQLPTALVGLAALVPPAGGDSGATVPATDVEAWTAALDASADALGGTAEGDEDQTVTRGALLGAVGLLRSAVEGTAGLPAEAGPARQEQLARVARDRDAGVALWQAGATRLDGLVLDAGGEHTHLFLAPDGDPRSVPREFQEPDED
ncbi:hypothetical protein ACFQL5_10900 [Aquipuribacter hungaricus]|uniref:Uncharacterized protein n=1 Tax=Aquipuribacter hungaricus TaxID=545624 RepID=A0ABV7WHS2_9MICO